jgi:prevent-host-death family protein
MPATIPSQKRSRVVPALTVRANFGKLLDGMDAPNGSIIISKRGIPKAVLLSIGDYLNLTAPEPEVLRIIGEESRRNGTDKMTEAEIDAVIQDYRAERRAGKQAKPGRKNGR